MVRIVADTNVIISAYEFGGNPGRVIDKAVAGQIEMAVSDSIMDEVWRVLGDKFNWPIDALKELDSVISGFAMKVHPTQKLSVIREDPDDDRILECAQAAEADYIITGDKHLLRLQRFGNALIITPLDFLREIEVSPGADR